MKARMFVLVVLLLSPGSPAWAQCPGFPQRGIAIIDQMYNGKLAWGSDDDRRQLTKTIIEELKFEFPNDGWTWKSADPGRPPSKDSISRQTGGRLCNWDWQNGATRTRSVQPGQIGDDITGQNPIPVQAVNHLGVAGGGTGDSGGGGGNAGGGGGGNAGSGGAGGGGLSESDFERLKAMLASHDSQDEIRYKDILAHFVDDRAFAKMNTDAILGRVDRPGWFTEGLKWLTGSATGRSILVGLAGVIGGRMLLPQQAAQQPAASAAQ